MLGLARLGEFSTAWYRKQIESLAPGLDYRIVDCDFARLNDFLPDNYASLEPLLCDLVASARQRGITRLLLPNITLHHSFYLYPQWKQGIALFDPFELLCEEQRGEEVVVLGTRYTQESAVLKRRIQEQGLELRALDSGTCERIDNWRQAIFQGQLPARQAREFNSIVKSLATESMVVIACSELSIVLEQRGERVVDLAMLQINAFVGDCALAS